MIRKVLTEKFRTKKNLKAKKKNFIKKISEKVIIEFNLIKIN